MRLIDAETLKQKVRENFSDLFDRVWINNIINEQPTIDAVQVVRCKDCKWRNEPGCALMIVDDSDKPKDYDYCSYGERKNEE